MKTGFFLEGHSVYLDSRYASHILKKENWEDQYQNSKVFVSIKYLQSHFSSLLFSFCFHYKQHIHFINKLINPVLSYFWLSSMWYTLYLRWANNTQHIITALVIMWITHVTAISKSFYRPTSTGSSSDNIYCVTKHQKGSLKYPSTIQNARNVKNQTILCWHLFWSTLGVRGWVKKCLWIPFKAKL